jgi:hypothetical protein
MHVDDIADRIAIARPDELDWIIRDMWVDHTNGLLDEAAMEVLDEAARARREALQARRAETRPRAPSAAKSAPRRRTRCVHRSPPPREKLFGDGRLVPLDGNGKARIKVLMRALVHPTEPGKHYGALTAKAEEVGKALLWIFHNAQTGKCIPGYDTIAKAAGCHRDTVAEAIKMLEAAGILTWCNRRARVTVRGVRKVIRISNSYRFIDPGTSKSEFPSRTKNQDGLSLKGTGVRPPWGIPDGVYDDRNGTQGSKVAAGGGYPR